MANDNRDPANLFGWLLCADTLIGVRFLTARDSSGGPSGTRTLDRWIKSPEIGPVS
jgi:hypothetical protein